MKFKIFISLILVIIVLNDISISQIGTSIPVNRRVDWTTVGYDGNIPTNYPQIINVKTIGAMGDGVTDDSPIIQNAINSANPSVLTLIYFPEGNYRLNSPISITNGNIVLKGAGPDYTELRFYNHNTSGDNIFVKGSSPTNPINVIGGNLKGSNTIILSSTPTSINPGDYIHIKRDMDMNYICNIPDAAANCITKNHKFAQIVKVLAISGNSLHLEDELSMDYDLSGLIAYKFNPIQNVGFENFKIYKPSGYSPDFSGSNIRFSRVANAWVTGIESDNTSVHHFHISNSTKIEIKGSYIHDAKAYFDGPGYGIYIGYGSTNCLVENNILVNLRHAIVLSISPNRNIIGYNYSNESKACSPCQSDIVSHGFYPHANLFEGNSMHYMDIDVYWGLNGPYLTFFRNKTSKFELREAEYFNLVGNTYQSNRYSNPPNLLVIPAPLSDISYYHTQKPGFISNYYTWPLMGNSSLSNINPAEYRYNTGGQFTINNRDQYHGYSIQNTGLYTGVNSINGMKSQLIRNKNELSIGRHLFYSNLTNTWDVGPMCTYFNSNGHEKVISSYYDNFGNASIYFSDKDGNTNNLIFSKPNCKITAITSGDFDGNGIHEIVLAYLENDKPRIYKSDDINDLEQSQIYSKSSVYWSVDALTTGDFDNDGDVELIIGFNSTGLSTTIYRNEDANSVGSSIYSHTSGYWKIGDIACGDFDGDGDDELISGFNSTDGPSIYKSETGTSIGKKISYASKEYSIDALAAGDLDQDGDDELVSGFNSSIQGPIICKSENVNYTNEVTIYNKPELYWKLSSLIIEKNPNPEDEIVIVNEIILNNNGNSFSNSSSKANFNMYPNPSKGVIFLETNFADEISYSFEIFNVNGQKIMERSSKNKIEKIDLNKLPNGMYFINVKTNSESYQMKFVINKN